MTILLTTHYTGEAEYADRIAIIDHGSIVALDSPDEFKRQVAANMIELATADNRLAVQRLSSAGFRLGEPGRRW